MAQTPITAAQIETILDDIAEGRDDAFTQPVAPAWSLDTGHSTADRIREIDARMALEIARVAAVFVDAPAAGKIAATEAVVAQIDAETARDGAAEEFEGLGPSLAVFRQLLFVPVADAGADPVDRVMQISSQFLRSPKPGDTYYEYRDPANLRQSTVVRLPGSDASWTTGARPPMEAGKIYALKKCRHVFVLGWYCDTSLYQVRDLKGLDGQAKLLLTVLYPLPEGADNARFWGAHARNVADGLTAVFVVLVSGDQILVYNVGVQSRTGNTNHQDSLDAGFKTIHAQFVGLLGADLDVKLPY